MAGAGNDTIRGGLEADPIIAGSGSDMIVVEAGWGRDTVQDFRRGQDKIVFDAGAGPAKFADLDISGSVAGAVVEFGGNEILLEGIAALSLRATDVIFAA